MKRLMSLFMVVCILFANAMLPVAAATEVTSLDFGMELLYMNEKTDGYVLTYTYSPKKADVSTIVWQSDNDKVVMVDNGCLYPCGIGSANIYAYNTSGTMLDSLQVNVDSYYEEDLSVITSVSLDDEAITLEPGQSYELDFSYSPKRAHYCSLFYISDNEDVVTAKDGVVTAVGGGSANVRLVNLYGEELASVYVNVNGGEIEGGDGEITDEWIKFYNEDGTEVKDITIDAGSDYWLYYSYSPEDADIWSWNWYSTDYNVISFEYGDGCYIYANSTGSADIVVENNKGIEIGRVSIYVTGDPEGGDVEIVEEGIIFYGDDGKRLKDLTLDAGITYWLNYTYSPEDANIWSWNWYSTNDKVATIGLAEGVCLYTYYAGSTDIVVENKSGTELARFTVYVNGDDEPPVAPKPDDSDMPTSITLGSNALEMVVGESYALDYWLSPEGADPEKIIWSTDDESVASVSNGVVYANGVGSACIKVYNINYRYLGSFWVYVSNPVIEMTDLTLNKSELELKIKQSETLYATVTPSDATYDGLYWYSDDSSIASVDSYGNVYAKGVGTTTITVSANNGFTASCVVTVTPIYVESITLNKELIELYVGGSDDLYTTSVLPSNATNRKVEWTSDDESVAIMNSSWGEVEAVGEGETVIRATAKDGSGVYAECRVVVTSRKVTGVTLDHIELELALNETFYLNETITPSYAQNQYVTWSSDNTSVATVNSYGKITTKSEGVANITVTTEDGGYTATCKVTVKRIPVTGVSFANSEIELDLNAGTSISAVIAPSNASNKNITYTTDNPEVLEVYSYGYMYGIGEGEANVIATTEDGSYVATCKVTVRRIPVTGVSFNSDEIQLNLYNSSYLYPAIEPSNATNRNITYFSSDSSVVSVSSYGYIYANKIGSAVITATTEDGGFVASCTVTVPEIRVTGISMNSSMTVSINSEKRIQYSVLPSNATNTKVTITSDNPDVAYVDSYGYVYGESEGEAVITVTTEDGGYSASCTVTVVKVPVTRISFPTSLYSYIGKYDTWLDVNVYPYDATNKNVVFTSSDGSVATIDGNMMYIQKAGSAIITATSEDSGVTATVPVEVLITMEETELTLEKGNTYNLNYAYNDKYVTGLNWVSSDPSVVTVENGVVTAVGKGTATVSLECTHNCSMSGYSYEVTPMCEITVTAKNGDFGNGVTWELGGENGTTLYIRGTGEIPAIYWYQDREYDIYSDIITDIVVESGVTSIGNYAFKYMDNLKRVYIADTVTSIGTDAFYNCSDYEYVVDENSAFVKVEDVLFNKAMTKLISYPASKTASEYKVPDTVTVIAQKAFAGNTSLEKVVIGKNTEKIESEAFKGCTGLRRIIVDKKLTEIGYYAFSQCAALKIYYYGSESEWQSIYKSGSDLYYSRFVCDYVPPFSENGYDYYIEDGAAYIAEYTGDKTGNLTVPSTLGGVPVKIIGELAFTGGVTYGYDFESITIPEGVEELERYAFNEITIKKINLPSTLKKIGTYALSGVKQEISVSENNQYYCTENGVLFNKDKTTLIVYPAEKSDVTYTVPDSVKVIDNSAFLYTIELENVILGKNVTTIGYYTFEGSSIKSITLPASLTNIEYAAFSGVNNLTDVYYEGSEERWNTLSIQNDNEALYNATIHFGSVPVAPVYIKDGGVDYDKYCFYHNVYVNGVEAGKTVVIAFYYKGKLVSLDYKPYNGEDYVQFERYPAIGTIDCVKAMVWEDMESMTPVCESAVVNYITD